LNIVTRIFMYKKKNMKMANFIKYIFSVNKTLINCCVFIPWNGLYKKYIKVCRAGWTTGHQNKEIFIYRTLAFFEEDGNKNEQYQKILSISWSPELQKLSTNIKSRRNIFKKVVKSFIDFQSTVKKLHKYLWICKNQL
jgi:hypothetical protein